MSISRFEYGILSYVINYCYFDKLVTGNALFISQQQYPSFQDEMYSCT
jgi:hypothetical protein